MIRLDDFLAANPNARLAGPERAVRFPGFAFDSRTVRAGELFIAVRTDRGDGHDHVISAVAAGAGGVVAEHGVGDLPVTCVLVPDTREATRLWARRTLALSGARIVGVTGSAGKTTTKEITAHLLDGSFRVFKNQGNYSGAYGLPIALGQLRQDEEIAVLEMAVDHFGEMATMVEMAPPEVALVTVVAPAHLAAFGDLDGVTREKGGLVEALTETGLAVLNADDERVASMARRSRAPVVMFGSSADAGFHVADVEFGPTGTRFTLRTPRGSRKVELPLLGPNAARSAAAAAAVASHFGVGDGEIAERLRDVPPVAGRLRPLAGRRASLILDDSYNASPDAVIAGLDVLAALPAVRRVAVLGEMAELGDASQDEHRRVGAYAAQVADVLVTRGKVGETVAEAAREAGMGTSDVRVTYTAEDAVHAVEPELGEHAVILVKGSAVARMERVVAGLMAHPERAAELLVRQDAGWRALVALHPDRPTWLEVDLGAVAANARRLASLAEPAGLMAVLKADAYGHGAVQVAHTVLANGADWLGVACLPEAAVLRDAGIEAPVLVLGYSPAWQARDAVRMGVRATVYDRSTAEALSQAAVGAGGLVRVHVKVDTGMRRLGCSVEEAPELVAHFRALPGLEVEGLFTHFAEADDPSEEARLASLAQLDAFAKLVSALESEGLRPPLVHAANSAALLTMPASRFDLVRPGIALYGLAPSREVRPDWLRPALAWKTQVAQVRAVPAGQAVGYGGAWRPEVDSRVATLPVGYADGFRRAPATWRHVLVRGQTAPVVGRVSMDQTAVDVTGIEGVRQGDEVVLIGRQGRGAITAEDAAAWLGTINYEVVSAILARVPRVP